MADQGRTQRRSPSARSADGGYGHPSYPQSLWFRGGLGCSGPAARHASGQQRAQVRPRQADRYANRQPAQLRLLAEQDGQGKLADGP